MAKKNISNDVVEYTFMNRTNDSVGNLSDKNIRNDKTFTWAEHEKKLRKKFRFLFDKKEKI